MNVFVVPLRKYNENYGLKNTYQFFFKKLGIWLLGIAPDIKIAETINFSAYDGLLLPGGGDIDPHEYGRNLNVEYDKEIDRTERKLYEVFTGLHKPVIGICRGLQVINVFEFGTLKNLEGHMDQEHGITYRGHRHTVNSYHHQSIDGLGRNLKAEASSDDGTVEVIRSENKKVLAFQFHPEKLPVSEQNFWLSVIGNFLKLKDSDRVQDIGRHS